ncbi:MAG: sugar transferase [Gammaproteobacteria bacterium]
MSAGRGVLKRHSSAVSAFTRALDVLACIAGGLLAYYLRFSDRAFTLGYPALILIGALLVLVVFPIAGVYQSWRSQGLLAAAGRALAAWITVFVLLMVLLVAVKHAEHFSRLWMAGWFGWVGLFVVLLRLAAFSALRMLRRRGFNRRQVVVIGEGNQARELVQTTRGAIWTGFDIVAVFSAGTVQGILEGMTQPPLAALAGYVETHTVDEVWIALPLEQGEKLREVLTQLRYCTANVRYAPDFFGLFLLNRGVTEILDVPMIDLTASPMQGMSQVIKGFEDRLLAASILVLISPVMLLIAIGVKLSSPGPVFYRQERVGWNRRAYQMLKFRSMRMDAEKQTGAMWANKDDDRATAFGKFIRRTSLD